MHAKTNTVEEDIATNKGVIMVLEFGAKAKEERTKCARENNCDDRLRVGNMELKSGNETLEKSVSELIKRTGSD